MQLDFRFGESLAEIAGTHQTAAFVSLSRITFAGSKPIRMLTSAPDIQLADDSRSANRLPFIARSHHEHIEITS